MMRFPHSCIPAARQCAVLVLLAGVARGNTPAAESTGNEGATSAIDAPAEPTFYIRHYRIKGARKLPPAEVEKAVYPYMGPACTSAHVEQARAALERSYREAGYGLVTVAIPPQDAKYGVITLDVTEGTVRRLRVRGARYFSPEQILAGAPSLAEGEVPDFEKVKRDILALNRHPDRQVLPDVKPGPLPGQWDVDLNVKDKLPLHGNLELNNRYSPDTSELRINGGISYTNLWQAGHTAGFNFQVAPENTDDAKIFSGFYMLPLAQRVSLMLNGTKQDSNVNTLGGAAVAGRGHVLGARVNFVLPEPHAWQKGLQQKNEWSPLPYYHSLSFGFDYKKFEEDLVLAGQMKSTPIEYYPISLSYNGTLISAPDAEREHSTDVNAGITFHTRGLGSDRYEFDAKRYESSGAFFSFRGDLAHTHELPGGMEIFAKVQGQWSGDPLINSEQFSGGGLGNARGYLESTVLGDSAVFGSVELRSPSLLSRRKKNTEPSADGDTGDDKTKPEDPLYDNEWRVYLFADGGVLNLNDPLPEQDDTFSLLSVGAGTRFSLWNHLHGSLDAGFPLRAAGPVDRGDWLMTFRLWTDF